MDWQTQQILCIESEDLRLYGEAIQIITERKLCWLRPVALVQWDLEFQTVVDLHDLREGSDLLCPDILCRAAFDTELLPVLHRLESGAAHLKATVPEADIEARCKLQSFLLNLCKMLPNAQ